MDMFEKYLIIAMVAIFVLFILFIINGGSGGGCYTHMVGDMTFFNC